MGFLTLKVEYFCRDVDEVACEGMVYIRSVVDCCILFLEEAFWRWKKSGG